MTRQKELQKLWDIDLESVLDYDFICQSIYSLRAAVIVLILILEGKK